MVGLLYLKHAFDESNESVVARWVENPYWQYFCGCQTMQHKLPIDPSLMSKWRTRVGAQRLEKLVEATIHTAHAMKTIKPQELQKMNVDTTVQEKTIAFPTDARLYQKIRIALIRRAKQLNIPLRQSYRFVGKKLLFRQGRYAHARHGKSIARRTNDSQTGTRAVRRMLKRRAAVEPTIGHLKSDNRLSRNHLTGKTGDQINTLLAAAGYNLRKLLCWVAFLPVLALFEWLEAVLNFKSPLKRHPLSP